MRVLPAFTLVLFAFVSSTLALRDYFTRDDLLSVARAYKRSAELVDMLMPRQAKGEVWCSNKRSGKRLKDQTLDAETLRKFEKKGCSPNGKSQFSSSHNCQGKGYYCIRANGGGDAIYRHQQVYRFS
ncbi:uncharacterized protein C8Q71DRAFT_855466 [Rhodofomes roseus]|uniref:Uncharacterized protein n=1 Tax=Rhodofomes roseus TaxID=34475 RepID=A0ABQ8KP27_9APHY|nr:uncharacterized protein C8Q71DRAFT_855466 [Rhodofomes roseus]KAH9840183.1 hypothetical protein C8Q71DRAFT_855466 [Rhodofomes roseus]